MNGISTCSKSVSPVIKRNELNKVVIDKKMNDVYLILDNLKAKRTKKNRLLYNKTYKSFITQLDAIKNRLQADFTSGELDSQGILNAYISRIELLKFRITDLFSLIK